MVLGRGLLGIGGILNLPVCSIFRGRVVNIVLALRLLFFVVWGGVVRFCLILCGVFCCFAVIVICGKDEGGMCHCGLGYFMAGVSAREDPRVAFPGKCKDSSLCGISKLYFFSSRRRSMVH
jgi:hypothetical protein